MKDIFSYNSNINKNAYLNWRTSNYDDIGNMIVLADGFMKSAIMLAQAAVDDNRDKKADIIIFPILFNANHAIELYLKAITWTLNILLRKDKKIEGQHDIKQIVQVVNAKVEEYETDKEKRTRYKEMIKNLQEYLDELYLRKANVQNNKKDNMDFSRYPFDQKYNSHFYIIDYNNVVVDLENFINRFTEIGDNLNSIATYYLYGCLDCG